MTTGRIFDIQRFSTHDGPGIRTTVFFKGCPLRCWWCGNPESLTAEPSLSYQPAKCIACGACVGACRVKAIALPAGGKAEVDRTRCTRAGDCAPQCDPKALQIVGRDATVAEVMTAVLRDRAYYDASRGGLTVSGGEPLAQSAFLEELLCEAKAQNLHVALETSGHAAWSEVQRVQTLVDLWLYDYKETDPRRHLDYTGVPHTAILDNLRRLHAAGAKILLRCPMIPRHNARPDHLEGIVNLARHLPNLQGVELLPYYDLWRGKLARFGLTTRLPETVKPPDRETVQGWIAYLRQRNIRVLGG